MQEIILKPIGVIHTPFKEPVGIPIQSIGGKGISGTIELEQKYIPALKDLDGFSHIILIYYFHRSKGYSLIVKPFMDDNQHGLFSTRAPKRPNPIGMSIVKLIKIEEEILHIEDLDILDGTPLLDIKPYVPKVDSISTNKIGWLTAKVDDFVNRKSNANFESKL
jgi:tRNA-Thr(GGU) m(6)t(6)A37 methyltransferase TsaA